MHETSLVVKIVPESLTVSFVWIPGTAQPSSSLSSLSDDCLGKVSSQMRAVLEEIFVSYAAIA